MIILDSSVWIALINNDDSCYEKARNIVKNIFYEDIDIYDFIFTEILTVLRKKTSIKLCSKFIRFIDKTKIGITLNNEKLIKLANNTFFKFDKLSYTDCLILASALLSEARLVTFDKNLQKAYENVLQFST